MLLEKIETTSAATRGICVRLGVAGEGTGGGGDGVLLEAAVCFAAVKSHTGNVGKHIQADASADDDSSLEVTQSRRRRKKTLLVTLGILKLSTSLRASFVVALRSDFFLSTTEAAHSSE